MVRSFTLLVLGAAAAAPAAAQSEADLRRFFEGKSVLIKLDMPGSEDGVDVYPDTDQPVDFPKHAGRLKRFGTAIHRGEEALITRIRFRGDHIEFHLGGGGYGSFGDDTNTNVPVVLAPKSARERTLEREVDKTTDPALKRKLRDELDDLRRRREREDNRNRAAAALTEAAREANLRQRRLEGGSRFNLHYVKTVPPSAMAPESVMRALAEYVDFGPMDTERAPGAGLPGDRAPGELRKGLTTEEVDGLLGRPEAITSRQEGSLSVSVSTYRSGGRVIRAEFVEGVLIRYTITTPQEARAERAG